MQNAIQQGNGQKKGINRRLPGAGGTGGTTGTNPPIEKFEFFYHGDHLGSSNFITDDLGAVYQDLEYFPYGETWVEEGGSGQMPMYRFTGKELDPETGLDFSGSGPYCCRRHKDIPEIPKSQCYTYRPTLERIFSQSILEDKRRRDRKIAEAFEKYGYTRRSIADHLGVHSTYVSRILCGYYKR